MVPLQLSLLAVLALLVSRQRRAQQLPSSISGMRSRASGACLDLAEQAHRLQGDLGGAE